jgi:glycosyltransferase involved in cell wall biosynthesis
LLPSLRLFKRLDFLLHAQSAARKFDADIIYTWLPQSAALGLWNHYPVILEMHADVAGHMGPWWLSQFWQARGWKRMTVTTQALRMALERSTNIEFRSERSRRTDQTVIIAPNGVDMESYEDMLDSQEARRQLNLKDGLTVGFTGHIYPGRGADLLFELAMGMPQVNFLWVGGTSELVEFWRGKLNEVNVVNVTMTGFVQHSRVPLYQAASDILLMPYSRSIEASSGQDIAEVINPMKMFEYMAAGRAIVTADLPVIREVLNKKNAVFCEPVGEENWESGIGSWKSSIEALLANEEQRFALGSQAREDVQGYTWTARAQRIVRDL